MLEGVVGAEVAGALARVLGSGVEGGAEGVSPLVMRPAVPDTASRGQRRNAIRMAGSCYPAGIGIMLPRRDRGRVMALGESR